MGERDGVGPNFFVIGFGKSGTGSLSVALAAHPEIFMSTPKEPNFFSNDEVWALGVDWYESLFDGAGSARARGEGSARYTVGEVYPDAAARIGNYAPDAKLIVIARHPIERIESLWLDMRSWGPDAVHHDFTTALRVNHDWLVASSNYWRELERYRSFFPDEQVHVVFFEDFRNDPASALRSCFEFLGASPEATLLEGSRHLNQTEGKLMLRGPLAGRAAFRTAFRVARAVLPAPVRSLVRRSPLYQPAQGRPAWDPSALRAVIKELEDDTVRFLEYAGKPADYWQLDHRLATAHSSAMPEAPTDG